MMRRPTFKRPEDINIPSIDFIKGYHLTFEIMSFDLSFQEWESETYSGRVVDIQDMNIVFEDKQGTRCAYNKGLIAEGLHLHGDDHLASQISQNYYATKKRDELAKRAEAVGEYSIYGLVDPTDKKNVPFYIGMSGNIERRFYQHITTHSGNPLKVRRIQAIQRRGLQPKLHIFEVVRGKLNALEREQDIIQFYKEQGVDLTNDVEVAI